jgi:hypothetical protein
MVGWHQLARVARLDGPGSQKSATIREMLGTLVAICDQLKLNPTDPYAQSPTDGSESPTVQRIVVEVRPTLTAVIDEVWRYFMYTFTLSLSCVVLCVF